MLKSCKEYNEKHKEEKKEERKKKRKYLNAYERDRRKDDIQFRLACNLRSRLSKVLKGKTKSGSSVRDLGCNALFLKWHLEAQFQSGMTWKNYGEWEIDHIKPLSSFDLTDRKQLLEACHFSNLQPLWKSDNRRKNNLTK